MRAVHRLTKSPLCIFSTLPKACFHSGRRFPQMHFLHHCSPFSMPVGRTHGLPRNALGVFVVFNRALDTLLMHHVSLGVIWVVTQRPSKLLGLNQKHVSSCTSVVPRVPDAAVTVLLELVVAKLKEPFV